MKLLLLASPTSTHTIKWAKSLAKKDVDIFIFGLSDYDKSVYENFENIKVYSLGYKRNIIMGKEGNVSKLRYLKALPAIKKIIKSYKPDIVHAHYASSYGLLGALSGFHPLIISVWGSDIFNFPRKSFLHKRLIKFNLKKADKILSTSNIMAKETQRYTNKEIQVTPFGVDLNIFKPMKVESIFVEKDIVVGTIKALEKKYGIDYLIRAFQIVSSRHPRLPLRLLIVGNGSQEEDLKKLVSKLDIKNKVIFAGRIKHTEVPKYHNMLSIFLAISISNCESFGVAVIEASACEKAVVVSNVGGLPEVVEDLKTGLVVPPKDPKKTAEMIEKLIFDQNLRKALGKAGRQRVKKFYDWQENLQKMINIYTETISERNKNNNNISFLVGISR